jgi:hypothetical protein
MTETELLVGDDFCKDCLAATYSDEPTTWPKGGVDGLDEYDS